MGLFASKPPQQIDLSTYIGQPYPYALMKLYEMDIRVFLVALEADKEYQLTSERSGVKADEYRPSSEQLASKNAVVILYDAETANVIRCVRISGQ